MMKNHMKYDEHHIKILSKGDEDVREAVLQGLCIPEDHETLSCPREHHVHPPVVRQEA